MIVRPLEPVHLLRAKALERGFRNQRLSRELMPAVGAPSHQPRLLGRRGYRVSGFTEPQEALAAARANPNQFDLAATDYNMPGMSGLDVARTLREIRADLPVMLISGYITEELQREAPAAGVQHLVFKADAVEEVCEAVARYSNAKIGKKVLPEPF